MKLKKLFILVVLITFTLNTLCAPYVFAHDYTAPGGQTPGSPGDGSGKGEPDNPACDDSPKHPGCDSKTPGEPKGECSGKDPINFYDGKFYYNYTFMEIPGAIPIKISANYSVFSVFNGPLGYGWSLNYDMRLFPTADGNLLIRHSDATKSVYISQGNGTYLLNNQEGYEVITRNPDGSYTLDYKNGWKYEFDINGVITKISDNNANSLVFSYDSGGKLPITGISPFSTITTPIVIGYDYRLIKIEEAKSGTLTGRYVNFDYDSNGRIIRAIDFESREVLFVYDSSGNGDLIHIEDPLHNQFEFAYTDHKMTEFYGGCCGAVYSAHTNVYDDKGRVIRQIHGNNITEIEYTDYKKTTIVTNQVYDDQGTLLNTQTEIYAFNNQGFSTQHVKVIGTGIDAQTGEQNDIIVVFNYDDKNRVTAKYMPKGSAHYTYDDKGNITRVVKQINNTDTITTDYTYDSDDNVISKIISASNDPDTYTTNFTYDLDHNRLTEEKVLDAATTYTTTYTYTAKGTINTVTDPQGNVTQYEYDSYGNMTKSYDPNNLTKKTDYTYDSLGNRASVTDANNNTTNFEYDNLNRIIKIINPKNEQTIYTWTGPNLTQIETGKTAIETGQITQIEYDSLNRKTAIKKQNENNEIITLAAYTYDSEGNIITTTDANNNTMTNTYDEAGRLIQTRDALTNNTDYEYDANSNLISVTDANGNITDYEYDYLNRLVKVTQNDNSVPIETIYTYDVLGNIKTITDAENRITTNTYDTAGRLTQVTSPMSHNTTYEYDANNNLIKKTDAKGQIIEYAYNAYNQLINVYYGGKFSPIKTVTFSYDNNGNMISWSDSSSLSASYTYDELNRVLSVSTAYPFGTKTINYTYDRFGNKASMAYPDTLGTVTYSYDNFNRLTQIDYPLTANRYTLYEYDNASRLTKKTLPNQVYTEYTYDNANRLTSLMNKKSDATAISSFNYTHDNVGNRLQTIDHRPSTMDYTYDDVYRLTQVDEDSVTAETYTYDKVGNRETSTDYSNWTYDNENKLTSYDGITYNYDNNGNLTSKNDNGSLTTYTWDYENRLIRVDMPNGDYAEYVYDPFGKRIKKDVYNSQSAILNTQYYLYDNEDIVVEYASNGTVAANYLHGHGVDEPISMTRDGNTYYYTMDGLGSVSELTDSSGAVVDSYEYDAFGNTTILDANRLSLSASAVGNSYMYTSREYDSETGLYFYRARYYDSNIGRFISQDPIGFNGGINFYGYVRNNPIVFVDPLGFEEYSGEGGECYDIKVHELLELSNIVILSKTGKASEIPDEELINQIRTTIPKILKKEPRRIKKCDASKCLECAEKTEYNNQEKEQESVYTHNVKVFGIQVATVTFKYKGKVRITGYIGVCRKKEE